MCEKKTSNTFSVHQQHQVNNVGAKYVLSSLLFFGFVIMWNEHYGKSARVRKRKYRQAASLVRHLLLLNAQLHFLFLIAALSDLNSLLGPSIFSLLHFSSFYLL